MWGGSDIGPRSRRAPQSTTEHRPQDAVTARAGRQTHHASPTALQSSSAAARITTSKPSSPTSKPSLPLASQVCHQSQGWAPGKSPKCIKERQHRSRSPCWRCQGVLLWVAVHPGAPLTCWQSWPAPLPAGPSGHPPAAAQHVSQSAPVFGRVETRHMQHAGWQPYQAHDSGKSGCQSRRRS